MDLRFIIRDGKRILQYREKGVLVGHAGGDYGMETIWEGRTEWQDVPCVEE